MGKYRKRTTIRKFWEDPLANGCFVLAVLLFVAGLFGLFAFLGKAGAGSLIFAAAAIVAGIPLIRLGKRQKRRKEDNA